MTFALILNLNIENNLPPEPFRSVCSDLCRLPWYLWRRDDPVDPVPAGKHDAACGGDGGAGDQHRQRPEEDPTHAHLLRHIRGHRAGQPAHGRRQYIATNSIQLINPLVYMLRRNS